MAQPLPNHPNLRGGFAPLQMECDVNDLVVEGEIPGTQWRSIETVPILSTRRADIITGSR